MDAALFLASDYESRSSRLRSSLEAALSDPVFATANANKMVEVTEEGDMYLK